MVEPRMYNFTVSIHVVLLSFLQTVHNELLLMREHFNPIAI